MRRGAEGASSPSFVSTGQQLENLQHAAAAYEIADIASVFEVLQTHRRCT